MILERRLTMDTLHGGSPVIGNNEKMDNDNMDETQKPKPCLCIR